jgi:hypothetical protein
MHESLDARLEKSFSQVNSVGNCSKCKENGEEFNWEDCTHFGYKAKQSYKDNSLETFLKEILIPQIDEYQPFESEGAKCFHLTNHRHFNPIEISELNYIPSIQIFPVWYDTNGYRKMQEHVIMMFAEITSRYKETPLVFYLSTGSSTGATIAAQAGYSHIVRDQCLDWKLFILDPITIKRVCKGYNLFPDTTKKWQETFTEQKTEISRLELKLEKMIESAMGEPNTCKGITKKGERCKTSLKIPSYCWRHDPSKN